VLRELGVRDPRGGPWYTGLARYGNDHFIFCGINVAGRTGHNYQNHFRGADLVWRGKTGSSLKHRSIQDLLSGNGKVHIFFRRHDRDPFTYAGEASAKQIDDVIPIRVRWRIPHSRD